MFETEFWDRVRDLFATAIELGPRERHELLQRECSGDDRLRAEVESLLGADEQADHELELSPVNTFRSDNGSSLPLDAIAGYTILEEIHRGGQGIVYKAIQHSTKREVALKVMLEGMFASVASKRRFEREIELASSFRHPGIVPIYDSGSSDGRCYYSMALIHGQPLQKYVETNGLSAREILRLFVEVCAVIDYTHQKGVIHRDLQPSNVLVDAEGNPHLLDFGLAKAEDQGDQTVTLTGQIMGTLHYMSPEQAAGEPGSIDLRSDVYALGVVLYRLLAGRLPYDLNCSMAENLITIQNAEPRKLTFRGHAISGEVNTIVLKALSKEKARRYATAGALGDDIDRYLRGYPIEAKRDSALYVLQKTMRRYRVTVAVAASFLVLIMASACIGWWLYLSADTAWRKERATSDDLRATSEKHLLASNNYRLASEKYRRERNLADSLRKESVRRLYCANMILAGQAANTPGGNQVVADLTSPWIPKSDAADHRGWEWFYLSSLCNRELNSTKEILGLARARWSHDGKKLAVCGFRAVYLFDENATKPPTVKEQDNQVESIAWSHDDTRLATGGYGESIRIWDTSNNALKLMEELELAGRIDGLCWSPTRLEVAAGNNLGSLRIWSLEESKLVAKIDGLKEVYMSWHPTGEVLAITDDASVKIIKKTGEQLTSLLNTGNPVCGVAWNVDGTRLASVSSEGRTVVWNMKTEEVLWSHEGGGILQDVVWMPGDDEMLATASRDRSVRMFNARNGCVIREIKGHDGMVRSVDWHPAGDRLLTTIHDSCVRIWPTSNQGHSHAIRNCRRFATDQIECSPDGTTLACIGHGPKVRFIRLRDEQMRHVLHPQRCRAIAWKPKEQVLASAADDQKIRLWRHNASEPLLVFDGHRSHDDSATKSIVTCLDWSPDGTSIVSGDSERQVIIWSTDTGKIINRFVHHGTPVTVTRWHPQGSLIISASDSGRILIWDAGTGKVQREISRGMTTCFDVRWNDSGDLFATASADGLAKIWNLKQDDPLFVLKGHSGQVRCVRWHPGGNRIATSSDDGTIKIWSTESGEEVLTIQVSDTPVRGMAWGRDGKQLYSASNDSIIRVWDASHAYQQ